jgi:hypothetical protein
VDLLAGSTATIVNCLFVENVSNMGADPVAKASGERPFVNNGVLTVFWNSEVDVIRCTFAGNRNGADDMGGSSRYLNCIFADNRLDAGLKGFGRYELAVNAGGTVSGCMIRGKVHDVRGVIPAGNNLMDAPPPRFNKDFVPEAPEYADAGYRPMSNQKGTSAAGNRP